MTPAQDMESEMSFRSPKLLKAAKDQPCVICAAIGTTVACHANSVALGKGTGIKCPDFYTAWLCEHHHAIYDGRVGRLTKEEKETLWTQAFVRTVARWFELNLVKVV